MHACVLTVEQREAFNELANRDEKLNKCRDQFNQNQWMSDGVQVFWMTTEQKDTMLSVWDIITPK